MYIQTHSLCVSAVKHPRVSPACMCVCVCIYIYRNTQPMYVSRHQTLHSLPCMYVCACMLCACMYIHVYTHKHAQTYTQINTHAYAHTHITYTCCAWLVRIEEKQNNIRMLGKPARDSHEIVSPGLNCVYVCVCIYIYIYIYTYICVHMYVYSHTGNTHTNT